ncbi:LLM class F420-dependent oxidoreductase [Amycolatopsis jejuensis]|uniref:LLM class F420-dependent oxidoreductase n=1 Tax=Amycolatopsis jejuensis TaxID=330084 RepID=UPI0005262A7E|nr:LLM class F420-dependent oxidoreductase [Amycolatopsis jejuensis]
MDFGISTFVTDEGIRPDVLGEALEERGFDSLFLAEHSHIPVSRETPYPGGEDLPRVYYRTLDPFVALTAAAVNTSELVLATGVALLIQRDVFHAAKEVASLDLVSRGRAAFGVGVGWNIEEMVDHGTDPRTRGALLDEQIDAVKEIWTREQAEFHGKHVDFDPVFSWPKPVQTPHPPIYVGGSSRAALRRVSERGDAWLPTGVVRPEKVRLIREWLAEQGRPEMPSTIFGGRADAEVIRQYAEAGLDRFTFLLPTLPEAETLVALDDFARLAAESR